MAQTKLDRRKGLGDLYLKMSIWEFETHQETNKKNHETQLDGRSEFSQPARPLQVHFPGKERPAPPQTTSGLFSVLFLTSFQTLPRDISLTEHSFLGWRGSSVNPKDVFAVFLGLTRVSPSQRRRQRTELRACTGGWGPGAQPHHLC